MKRFSSVADVSKESKRLQDIILFSKTKREITKAFEGLKCLITGRCICDLCPEWDKDTYIVYEFGRCIIPSRFLQLIKEVHVKSKRWSYIQPLYRELYQILYEDLISDTNMSNGELENIKCGHSTSISQSTLNKINQEFEKLKKMNHNVIGRIVATN